MTDHIEIAAGALKLLEGCRLTGYPDQGGKATNGYGHTGPEVKVGVTITQEIADHDLDIDLGHADSLLANAIQPGPLATLSQHQRAALDCFVFNVGCKNDWTIWDDINAGRLDDVPAQLRRFDKVRENGRLVAVAGLDHRRAAEIHIWETGDVATAALIASASPVPQVPSGYLRDAVTPPTPLPPKPLNNTSLATKCAGLVSACVVGVGSLSGQVGTTATQVLGIVQPHVETAPIFATVVTVLTGIVVITGVIGVFIHAHQQAQAKL